MRLKILFGVVLLVFVIGIVSAQYGQVSTFSSYGNSYVSSNVQVSQPGFYGGINSNFDPLNPREYQEICRERTDFIIQIVPGGCSPNVVRSDLLAEQNVPVFCQLQAIQVNPLIDASRIRNIRLTSVGPLPKGVSGLAFHRANSGLYSPIRNRQGFATIDNIGYMVIVLERQPNENLQLDEIIGQVNARIDYDALQGFGFGLVNKPLPVLSDEEWRVNYQQYGFLEGAGFLRIEDIRSNNAVIGIYTDANNRVDSFSVSEGRTSRERFLPGFSCNAAYTVSFIDSVQPEPRASIRIDNNEYDVTRGEKFAQQFGCQVRSIIPDGNVNDVDGDNVDNKIDNCPLTYNLKQIDGDNDGLGDLCDPDLESENNVNERINEQLNAGGSVSLRCGRNSVNLELKRSESAGLIEIELRNRALSAIKKYETIAEFYENVKLYDNPLKTYGGESLKSAIGLSELIGDTTICLELKGKMQEKYGENAVLGIDCLQGFDITKAFNSFVIDGQLHVVRLLSVSNPTLEEKSIVLSVNGKEKTFTQKGEVIFNSSKESGDKGDKIILRDFNEDFIKVQGICSDSLKSRTEDIYNGATGFICGEQIIVKSINLQKLAKIRINPINKHVGSSVNFSYGIGIEQRAIKLNPEKSAERIKRLDESIGKWKNVNQNLENVVEGMKAACFATSAALQVKNLLGGLGGKAIARDKVMETWHQKCDEALNNGGDPLDTSLIGGPYTSKDDCFFENAKLIEEDVNLVNKALKLSNEKIEANDKQSKYYIEGGFLNGDYVKPEARNGFIENTLINQYSNFNEELQDPEGILDGLKPSDVINSANSENLDKYLDYSQVAELHTQKLVLEDESSSSRMKEQANKRIYEILQQVDDSSKFDDRKTEVEKLFEKTRAKGIGYSAPYINSRNVKTYDGFTAKSSFGNIVSGDNIVSVSDRKGDLYIVKLQETTRGFFQVESVHDSDGNIITNEETIKYIDLKYRAFLFSKAGDFSNQYINPKVRFHELGVNRGRAAIVPVDVRAGWYAATRSIGPAYHDSGRVHTFWLCNVGSNGKEEFDSLNKDVCAQFNQAGGVFFNPFESGGISKSKLNSLVQSARGFLESATSQHRAGIKQIRLSNGVFEVGNPSPSVPGTSCADFMDARDCKIMFNVCDPVICPSSRCNLGGNYHVDNVVNTGIIGSTLLCLPNVKEGIAIPVCLTGINAGIESYVSILEAHRACLQENIDTGRYVGICDETTAIYQCEFFWNQISPVANNLLPALLERTKGGSVPRGGGEYLSVQSAWDNTKKSLKFFQDQYAVNTFEAFRARSTSEVGAQICKGFVSTRFPTDFKTLIEADSPTQFSAWFDEIPQTSSTVPPRSHYKVFYHIFAGDDVGVQYSVFLKDAPGTSFFQDTGFQIVETGFIPKGGFVDEARDIISVSGFKQLCVRINAKEECGFQRVSTSFALDYTRDKFISNQITQRDITTEKECISGTPSALGLLNPNLQSGVEEALDPQIAKSGIVRVCSSNKPDLNSDPGRWLDVGNCGEPSIGCWLDQDSVDRAITSGNDLIKNRTITALDEIASSVGDAEKVIIDSSQLFGKEGVLNKLNEVFEDFLNILKTGELNELKKQKRVVDKEISTLNEITIANEDGEAYIENVDAVTEGEIVKIELLEARDVVRIEGSLEDDDDRSGICFAPGGFELDSFTEFECESFGGTYNTVAFPRAESESEDLPPLEIDNEVLDLQNKFNSIGFPLCSEYAEEIIELSKDNDVDPLLIGAIIIKESSCVLDKNNGGSLGLMQVNTIEGNSGDNCGKFGLPLDRNECTKLLLGNSRVNINVGIQIFLEKKAFFRESSCQLSSECNKGFIVDVGSVGTCNDNVCEYRYSCDGVKFYSGDDAILRAYNGWSCTGGDIGYVERVRIIYDKLKEAASS